MSSQVSEDIISLFKNYERLASELDFKGVAKLYDNQLVAAGPKGVGSHRNNFLTRYLFDRGMRAFYKKAGMTSIKLKSLEEQKIGNYYSLVKVYWVSTFQKTGEKEVGYYISYLVKKTEAKLKILLFISHEDEQEVLQNLGILA